MELLAAFQGQELVWVQPQFLRHRYELRAGTEEQVLATLQVSGRSATGEVSNANYSFKRQGFFKQRITIQRTEDQVELGVYAIQGSGGILTLADGRTLQNDKVRKFSTERLWKDEAGASLLSIYPSNWSGKVKIMLAPAGAALPELGLMVLLAEYLIVLAQEEAAAVAAVVPVITAG